jgi:HEAT repeat protein
VDDDAYWAPVYQLQRRDVHEVWELMGPLASDEDPRVRALVPDVLRFLGRTSRPLTEDSVALLRRMLRDEASPLVLRSIGNALGEMAHPASVGLMIPFARHPDPSVRRAVVGALLTHREPAAIETLLELSRDADDGVRDWATFGLGTQLGPTDPENRTKESFVDTPALRDALAARLDDPHIDTRCEAVVGLAMRRDLRALSVLKQEIAKGPEAALYLEAARWLGAPELCAGLRKLAASEDQGSVAFWTENGLNEAIAACCVQGSAPLESPESRWGVFGGSGALPPGSIENP